MNIMIRKSSRDFGHSWRKRLFVSYFCCQWLAKNLQKRRGTISFDEVFHQVGSTATGILPFLSHSLWYFKHHVLLKDTLERGKLDLDSNKTHRIFLEFLSLKSFKLWSLPDRTFMNSQQRAIFSLDAFLKILLWLTNYNVFYQQINFYFLEIVLSRESISSWSSRCGITLWSIFTL